MARSASPPLRLLLCCSSQFPALEQFVQSRSSVSEASSFLALSPSSRSLPPLFRACNCETQLCRSTRPSGFFSSSLDQVFSLRPAPKSTLFVACYVFEYLDCVVMLCLEVLEVAWMLCLYRIAYCCLLFFFINNN